MSKNINGLSDARVQLVNNYLASNLARFRQTVSQRFSHLIDAMEYSLSGGGKRLRPLLVLAGADYVGVSQERVLPAACAIEYLHTYSLIHDDLPALDNDDTRRDKPSSHKKFGEAVAILTGDALLTEAFGQMLLLSQEKEFNSNQVLSAIELLVHGSGVAGMVGGQLLDVTVDAESATLPEVEFIHIHKTGAMILAATLLPAKLHAVDSAKMDRLRHYGAALGLAFQISDDLLDSSGSARYSRDSRNKPKPSYCSVMAPSEIRGKLNGLIDAAVNAIKDDGEPAEALISIAEFVRSRKH